MARAEKIHFITDENGKKKSVVLPVETYEEMLEDIQDLVAVAERKDEDSVPFETVMKSSKPMGFYSLSFKRSVEKDLRKLNRADLPKLLSSIKGLARDPFPAQSRKLVGAERTYRMRTGDYRVIYLVDEKRNAIEVQRVRHRKDVYR